MTDTPQIYLISPPSLDPDHFPTQLARVLDSHEIACLRLALSAQDEDTLARSADLCRDVAIERDVAVVMDDHFLLAQRLGLDGVHLTDGARSLRKAREALGSDAIIGTYCAQSKHDGMSAGEAGADYVSFGPIGPSPLGDGAQAPFDLFEWWSQMIEVPVVAEGALDPDHVQRFAQVTDFFGVAEIWAGDDPSAALTDLLKAL